MRTHIQRWLRVTTGVLAGACTAVVELPFALVAGFWLLSTLGRRSGRAAEDRIVAVAQRLADGEQRRMATFFGTGITTPPTGLQSVNYVATRWTVGLLGGVVLACGVVGAVYASLAVWGWFVADIRAPGTLILSSVGGLFLLYLCVQGTYGVALADERHARRFLGPNDGQLMERRIGELVASRAGVVEAVHDERRRIERDLHDGVQQRIVALGMLLGRARRASEPEKSARLLAQAHEETQQALVELRDVAWRVYPAALDEGGLAAALETVAERAAIPVRLDCALHETPPPTAQAVAYFVAAEAVTNAVKHSGATLVTVHAERRSAVLRLRVEDDGRGGADPSGSGLLGLARRVAALDGTLTVESPAGGPTLITAELPCA
ncbi:sensor histidine kinase [Streptomyces sp. BA2]|uniref:sensor histidine kinase n=1 Tax=Streptomyces sp. BA2 TaxID=436595 RepID=UPI0013293C1F|nr:sensor histidine kinase [Streptomyces sp. BA2]MWA09576.1 sensor histidine kinase [Streptomyces sp. BA2]